ncbi:MAG: hypothetical protein Q4F31_04370 [Eubacteriales bacterium]|nr:hypothetical protein [Eubacteriales bacterium]
MLKSLIRKQLLEMWQGYFIDRKTGKARTKTGTVFFFLLLVVLFLGLGYAFYSLAGGLGGAILGNGFNWLYFALMGLLSMALGVFGSVFNTYAGVYLPKDNELLLSLPIPGKMLLFARLTGVYLTSLMYSAWVWIPVIIAYWLMVPVNVLNVAFPVLMTFVIALFVTVLSCILGWVVALIASKAKGKSFVTLFLSLAVIALYYFVYFKIVGSISEILSHIAELGNTVKSWLHYSYLLGKASDGDVLSMLLVTGLTLVLAGLCFLVLSKTFTKLSVVSASSNRKKKVIADYTKKPVKTALLNREYKHFTSVSTWMLNGGFGLMLLPIGAVVLLIKRGAIREFLPEIATEIPKLYALLPVLFPAAVCLILSVNAISTVAVSMEGKTIWQLQSLPLDPWEILRAKEKMSVQLNLYPAIFFVLVCGTVLQFKWWETALICVAVWFFIWAFSDFGLFLNLKMPNFSWTNVASLTKQSMPVVISMFGGWGLCAAVGFGGSFLAKFAPVWTVLCAYILLFLILWLVLHSWLKKKGTKIFVSL